MDFLDCCGNLGKRGDAILESIHKTNSLLDEQHFIKLVDHLFDGIISVDSIGTIEFASQTILHELKVTPTNIIGKNINQLIVGTDIPLVQSLLKRSVISSENVVSGIVGIKNECNETIQCEITIKNLMNEQSIKRIIIYCRKLSINKKTSTIFHQKRMNTHDDKEQGEVRLHIEADLSSAVERDEFVLYYQPKVNLQTRQVVGVEALIRWNHPTLGFIAPDDFIPLAEKTGDIIGIGKWVMLEAMKQNKRWLDEGYSPMVVSVNLSLHQFTEKDLANTVDMILRKTGLPARYLELEITESMTANIPMTIAILHQLKALGVLISVDDFGTGYSTLNHLKEFPIDILKIDKSFILNLADNPKDQAIVKTIISLAHNLNLHVIAEGIEEEETCLFLTSNNCHEGQGYLFSKPVPSDELTLKLLTCGRIRQ